MKRIAPGEYLDRAALTREQAERLFARMPGKLERRGRQGKLGRIEAVAIRLELEPAFRCKREQSATVGAVTLT